MTDTTRAHELAASARASFQAAHSGDLEAVLATFHPDIVWTNDDAAGPWSGTFRGTEAVGVMQLEFLAFMEGTFRQELLDVCASDDRVVLVLRELGTRDGHEFDNRAIYVMEADENGQAIEVCTLDRDREQARAFWDAVWPADKPRPATGVYARSA